MNATSLSPFLPSFLETTCLEATCYDGDVTLVEDAAAVKRAAAADALPKLQPHPHHAVQHHPNVQPNHVHQPNHSPHSHHGVQHHTHVQLHHDHQPRHVPRPLQPTKPPRGKLNPPPPKPAPAPPPPCRSPVPAAAAKRPLSSSKSKIPRLSPAPNKCIQVRVRVLQI